MTFFIQAGCSESLHFLLSLCFVALFAGLDRSRPFPLLLSWLWWQQAGTGLWLGAIPDLQLAGLVPAKCVGWPQCPVKPELLVLGGNPRLFCHDSIFCLQISQRGLLVLGILCLLGLGQIPATGWTFPGS